jgi:hypothetical protein
MSVPEPIDVPPPRSAPPKRVERKRLWTVLPGEAQQKVLLSLARIVIGRLER